jgi:hypothetical protein
MNAMHQYVNAIALKMCISHIYFRFACSVAKEIFGLMIHKRKLCLGISNFHILFNNFSMKTVWIMMKRASCDVSRYHLGNMQSNVTVISRKRMVSVTVGLSLNRI